MDETFSITRLTSTWFPKAPLKRSSIRGISKTNDEAGPRSPWRKALTLKRSVQGNPAQRWISSTIGNWSNHWWTISESTFLTSVTIWACGHLLDNAIGWTIEFDRDHPNGLDIEDIVDPKATSYSVEKGYNQNGMRVDFNTPDLWSHDKVHSSLSQTMRDAYRSALCGGIWRVVQASIVAPKLQCRKGEISTKVQSSRLTPAITRGPVAFPEMKSQTCSKTIIPGLLNCNTWAHLPMTIWTIFLRRIRPLRVQSVV